MWARKKWVQKLGRKEKKRKKFKGMKSKRLDR